MRTFSRTNNVPLEVFCELKERLSDVNGVPKNVLLNYEGSALRGEVTITQLDGYSKEYKEALKVFVEIYCGIKI
jgi:hypothetical protein